MASDSPTTQSPTTPQQSSLSPTASTKKARRQTAFYPNVNSSNKSQKPFSRSAAKRESVMTLGSIEHLQHYFTKTGLAAKTNPLKQNRGLVPAIGPGVLRTDIPSSAQEPNFILPPSPMIPPTPRPSFPPFVKTYQTDPEVLKPGVIEDLEVVESVWHIRTQAHQQPRDPDLLGGDVSHSGGFDVLSALKTTTRTIRSVRNYLVALPDDFATPGPQHEFRPHSLSPPTALARKISHPDSPDDPLTLVRRAALDVLTVLRNLEEKARIPLSDDVYDAQSDAGSTSTRSHTPGGTERVASPFTATSGDDDEESTASFSFSVVKVPSHKSSVPVWSDDEDSENDEDATEKRERWDERLVIGGGWLYKQDLTLENLAKEREAVGKYLDAVDRVLFGDGEQEDRRGWEKEKERLAAEREREAKGPKSRRASAGDGEGQSHSLAGARGRRIISAGMVDAMRDMVLSEEPDEILQSVAEADEEEDGVDDSELPDWAKRSKFANDPLARTLSLLVALLPADLLPLIPSPSTFSRDTILLALSSGQILCIAYNTAVRKSRKPWGYINKAAIHDIAALESAEVASGGDMEKRKKGWTFRRTDNLRLWAAALKLRYLLPLVIPRNSQGGTPLTSPTAAQVSFPSVEPPLLFDPQLVARRDEGWEMMLETAIFKWTNCVVEERRKGR